MGGNLYLLDTYNQAVHEDVACTIRTNINTANHHFIYEKVMKDLWGCGKTRDAKGNVEGWHLNPYVNCIHTLVGHSRLNMEVLIAELDMSEIKYIGQMSSSHNSRVIDPEGISYAVTNGEKDGEPKIIEPIGCAMRGRNPENPSERGRSNGKYKQRIEMGSNISNTITSVQKDSLVAEPVAQEPYNADEDGCAKAILAGCYKFGAATLLRKSGATMTSVIEGEPLRIPQATKQGYVEVQPGGLFDMSYPESKTRRGRVQEGGTVSPTLMASGDAPCLFEGVSVHPNSHALEFKGEKSIKTDASLALRATDYKAPHCVWENSANYRIRKLTPRECFRLMGVSETDIDKIQQSGVSQSQQYKMAGNSIVVDVLEHIFRKMFVDTGQESQQLLLF